MLRTTVMRSLALIFTAVNLLLFSGFLEAKANQLKPSNVPDFKPIGCYRDRGTRPRPLPKLIANLRSSIDWNDLNKTIRACARRVYRKGFHYFSIQYYGECWSGKGAEKTYKKHGSSTKCIFGVGRGHANFVYAFLDKEMEVRLVNGPNNRSGRVEVFHRGTWGTVCDTTWDMRDANVVCTMLGYPEAAEAPGGARFGKGKGRIQLDGVQCIGNEENLADCPHKDYTFSGCSHAGDAGVVCRSDIEQPRVPYRLTGGPTHSEGRVEVYHKRRWGTVCDKGWDLTDAGILCRMLAYKDALATPKFGQGSGAIWLSNVNCTGAENSIFRCAHAGWGNTDYCDHSNDAGVKCQWTDLI